MDVLDVDGCRPATRCGRISVTMEIGNLTPSVDKEKGAVV